MKKSLFVASTLLCLNVYADSATAICTFDDTKFDRGDAQLAHCPSGYNMPAQVHLDERDYQGFITASYLYWNAQQDGLDVATQGSVSNSMVRKAGVPGKTLFQDFGYHSGYKVGLGYNFEQCDNWTLRADYTSLHQKQTTHHHAPTSTVGVGALFTTNWFFQTASNQNPAAGSISSTWDLDIDWLDAAISRAIYQGQRFTSCAFAGLRASWISQDFDLTVNNVLNFGSLAQTGTSHNTLSSWGIGPRAGMEGRFLLGLGMRLQGALGASLLFTNYTRVSHSEDPLVPSNSKISYHMDDYTCLRPMLEANVGFGWGMYFSRNRYHIDLSATYDFNYMWSQNMMRVLNEINLIGSSASGLDLSLQGLTLSASFHF